MCNLDFGCTLSLIIQGLYVVILIVLAYFLYQIACIAASFRRITKQCEKLVDFAFWGDVFKGLIKQVFNRRR